MGKKGFTLVELLVAVVIVGVLTGLALPDLKQWIDGIKVKKVARQIVTDLQLAKTMAISEGIQYKVYFDTALKRYYIQKGNLSSGSTAWATVGTARELSNAANPYYTRDVAISHNFPSSCPDCVIFSPTGSAYPAGKVTCSSSGSSRDVYVILAGRIRVE